MADTRRKSQKEQRQEELRRALESDGRILPNNFDAEQHVLGCAIMDQEAALTVVSKLEEIDFYNETHRNIFKVIKELYVNSKNINIVTVHDGLEKKGLINAVGGIAYITSLSSIVPSSAGVNNYIEIVKRDSVLRQVIMVCGDTITKAYEKDSNESILGMAEKAIFEIAEKGQTGALERANIAIEKVINKIEEIHKDPTVLRGLRTGFFVIDEAVNGLQKTDLIILAARPGVGKTSLAMNIVSNAAINYGAKCAIFSLEMGREQLMQRMLFSVAGVSMAKALRGKLDQSEWVKVWKAKKKIDEAEIYIDDNAMNTPSQVLSKCRKLKREKGLDLVVIDYLGLMKADTKADNRQNEVADISRNLKLLAKEVEVPVLSLCQLNRSVEGREEKDGKPAKPMLSDLRDSGSIEQDADMVWFIHRDMTAKEIQEDKTGNYTAEIIIAKFRNGQPGSVYVGWDGSRTSFVNLEKDANKQSIVNQYEQNEENRKQKSQVTTAEDIKNTIESIKNEIDADDSFAGLEPPPEMPPEMDFSNISIDADDELF